jgi:hypothetical protein
MADRASKPEVPPIAPRPAGRRESQIAIGVQVRRFVTRCAREGRYAREENWKVESRDDMKDRRWKMNRQSSAGGAAVFWSAGISFPLFFNPKFSTPHTERTGVGNCRTRSGSTHDGYLPMQALRERDT